MGEGTSIARQPAAAPTVRMRMRPLIWVDPASTIGDAAGALDEVGNSCVLVQLRDGLGIATDHDFRASLADDSLSRDSPIGAICSSPAATVNEHVDAPAALLEMVERGIHHLVVTNDSGNPVGVVRVVDLASADVRDPLLVRQSVHNARDLEELRKAAATLVETAIELHEIGTPALRVSAVVSAVRDLVVQRVVELTPTVVPPTGVSWLVLGSLARREALPQSDVDTALVWPAHLSSSESGLRADAELVLAGIEYCGLPRCPDGANATEPLFSRSAEEWAAATRRWIRNPESDSTLLLTSIVADNRPITHVDLGSEVTRSMLAATRDRTFLGALLHFTITAKPARGMFGTFAVAHTGAHRGTLDLKRGGLWPVILLGRWMALVAGDPSGTTVDRIRRGAQSGLLTSGEAEDLTEAFRQVFQLRFAHEIAALRSGVRSDSHVAPASLEPLQRRYLNDSLHAISRMQTAVLESWTSG